MISNTRSGEGNLAPDAVGRGVRLQRPECTPRPFQLRVLLPPLVAGVERVAARPGAVTQPDCRAILSPEIPRTAERRAAPHPQRAAHLCSFVENRDLGGRRTQISAHFDRR